MRRCDEVVAEGVLKLLAVNRVVGADHPDLAISPEELRRAAYRLQQEGFYVVILDDRVMMPRRIPPIALPPLNREGL
jgi:hypothetical protein